MERTLSPCAFGSASAPVTSRRRFFFLAMMARASSSASGAMMTSVKSFAMSSAAIPSRATFEAMMPPKALTGSQASARS